MSNVVRMIDRVPGIAVDGHADLMEWLEGWADRFRAGDYGELRSLVVVVEDAEGSLAVISQSTAALENSRAVGLLAMAAHRMIDDGTDIRRLEK